MKVKNSLMSILLCCFFMHYTSAQNPSLIWQYNLGGSLREEVDYIENDRNNGIILVSGSDSNDGLVINHPVLPSSEDGWFVKLDSAGTIILNKCFGGSFPDDFKCVKRTFDSGYIFIGSTSSYDGNLTGVMGPFGVRSSFPFSGPDIWVVKTDSIGNISWQSTFGGSESDNGIYIEQTSDSGYIFVGTTSSNDGDISGYHGNIDIWICKLNSQGNRMWARSIGGILDEIPVSCTELPGGNLLIACGSTSNDGDIQGNHGNGSADCCIFKLSAGGTILWQKCYGGSGEDAMAQVLILTDGFYIAGSTNSIDGDISGLIGTIDMNLIKVDTNGTIIWQKCLGSTGFDATNGAVLMPDNGVILAGTTDSNDSLIQNNGVFDGLLIRVDSLGNYLWNMTNGGSSIDGFNKICRSNNVLYVGGYSESIDGDITFPYGSVDGRLFKLEESPLTNQNSIVSIKNISLEIIENKIHLLFWSPIKTKLFVLCTDLLGRENYIEVKNTEVGYNDIILNEPLKNQFKIISISNGYWKITFKLIL